MTKQCSSRSDASELCLTVHTIHRRRKVKKPWGEGGQGLAYWGPRGVKSQQAHDVVTFRRHVPTKVLINQCQIIAFPILKSYIIQNSTIELRGIDLPVPSNQIKVTFIIILPFSLVLLGFISCFT